MAAVLTIRNVTARQTVEAGILDVTLIGRHPFRFERLDDMVAVVACHG